MQEKVFEEIDSEIGDDQVTANHRTKLPYTEATLFEIWRCGPVGPIGDLNFLITFFLLISNYMLNYLFIAASRCPRKDTKIGNYTISAGTIVFPNLYSMTTGYSSLE